MLCYVAECDVRPKTAKLGVFYCLVIKKNVSPLLPTVQSDWNTDQTQRIKSYSIYIFFKPALSDIFYINTDLNPLNNSQPTILCM